VAAVLSECDEAFAVGETGPVRIALGCALAGVYLALECFGAYTLLGGHVAASGPLPGGSVRRSEGVLVTDP